MDGAFGRPRDGRKPFIDITPLIDVMFLLLIFFMVSSTFRERLGLDVALPETEAATQQEESPFEITVTEDGTFGYNDAEGLDEAELEAALRADLETNPDAAFVLRGDRGARYERYIAALGIVKEAGVEKLILQTKPGSPDVLQVPEAP